PHIDSTMLFVIALPDACTAATIGPPPCASHTNAPSGNSAETANTIPIHVRADQRNLPSLKERPARILRRVVSSRSPIVSLSVTAAIRARNNRGTESAVA